MKRPLTQTLLMGLLAGTLAMPRTAPAANEFVGFAVTDFGGTGQCSGSDLFFTTKQNNNIYNVFNKWKNNGLWDAASKYSNSAVDGRDFTDSSKNSTCSCSACSCIGDDDNQTESPLTSWGCDSADVCFLSTHGGASASTVSSARVWWKMGDSSNDCEPSSDNNMLWGNSHLNGTTGDTDILIVDACRSGEFSVYQMTSSSSDSGFLAMVDSTSTLSTFLGYHGLAPDRYAFIDNFAEDAYDDGIGEAWLTNAHSDSWGDGDACPVALIYGDSSSKRDRMFFYGGFNDRKDTGNRSASVDYWYVEGCDPNGSDPIP